MLKDSIKLPWDQPRVCFIETHETLSANEKNQPETTGAWTSV